MPADQVKYFLTVVPVASVNQRLRELRRRARPTLSGIKMAELLGFENKQAYYHYESEKGFKGRFLPMDLARRIAAILAERGVNPDEVLVLAGVGIDESSTPDVTAGESRLLSAYRDLDPETQQAVQALVERMRATQANQVSILSDEKKVRDEVG